MALVPDTEENMARCICGGCPTYPGTGGFFCAKGKSDQPAPKKGCVCGDCENFTEYGLQDGYYCWEGKAGEGPR